jgi:mRNA-degrading endonuclease RelE of RelBE toxin-antitoxin system
MTCRVGLASPAIRELDRLPRRIVPAVIEFLYGPLAEEPRRVGEPLRDDFAGEWSARRGSYRVLCRVDEAANLVTVPVSLTDPAHPLTDMSKADATGSDGLRRPRPRGRTAGHPERALFWVMPIPLVIA